MKLRRVLLCCENYPPSVGGVQEVMRQVAQRLAAKGISVTVATSAHPARASRETVEGVDVVSFEVSGNAVRGIGGAVAAYRSFMLNGQFDAVLIKAAQQWTFDAAIEVLPLLGCRKVFVPCGFSSFADPSYAGYYRSMPSWLGFFDALVFYATDYQDLDFARQHGLRNLCFIPNGFDEREFASVDAGEIRDRLGIPASHDLLLSVGSLIAAKGHWEVVRAFRQAKLPRATTLVINGNTPSGGAWSKAKRLLRHLGTGRLPLSWEACSPGQGTQRRVLCTDLARPDLVSLYKAADLFVSASHVEYSPLVLFEAAAAGTPFIASPAGNSSEIAVWSGGGEIAPMLASTDAQAFVQWLSTRLEQRLGDRESLAATGRRSRQRVFDAGLCWASLCDSYLQVLAGSGHGRADLSRRDAASIQLKAYRALDTPARC